MDWDEAEHEAVELFKGLLRLDTTNPPGNETRAAEYLETALREEGLDPWLVEDVEGRANLVARLPATVDAAPEEAILLAGHTDVVPADETEWTHPPFGAVEEEGCIWGRGAVDMKNMIAMSAMVVKLLAREGEERTRDVVFAAVADEEQGCEHGSEFLVEEHPDRLRADVMFGEVGGFWQSIGGQSYMPVMVAEKGRAELRLRARGPTGHGSIPRRQTALAELGEAIRRLSSRRLPYHRTGPVERFVRRVMQTQSVGNRIGLRGLLHGATAPFVLDRILPDPDVARNFDALLHNTATPTLVDAGESLNKIPGEASCSVDGRLLPGFTGADLVREVEGLLEGLAVEVELVGEQPAVQNERAEGPVFETIERVVGEHAPEVIPVPYMIPGYTDARNFSRLGIDCWGFAPTAIPADRDLAFSELFHGVDERIPVDGFKWGLRVLYEVVEALV